MVRVVVAFSQRLFERIGLFIPPPLIHLRVLDGVKVQRSPRQFEDHIQAILVLKCSSIAHAWYVCLVLVLA
jgi:hypothetical protein